ncbi:MAG: TIGR00269 family protein [Candidatus Bathyarchaeota archaeon]|nr:TIGR00269 family protein [Candidatus Bathyarchaeota archaeon A05DMB-5]MDH7557765.1 TIGR00269 family protein [Candidatus Bathyarchaeota archaeon]
MNSNTVICTACNRKEAFFSRPYSGEKLCKKCFTESIETKVKATIAKYQMLNFNDKIAVAVSGGKDSVSLLHILAKLERRYPKASLVAVTVDEGIKGYRDEALKIAAENCRKLGIKHHVVSFQKLYGCTLDEIVKHLKLKGNSGPTPCAFCGVMRRRTLNTVARKLKVDKLVTAHTLDDETQTILLNIFHGDVLRIAREKPVTDEAYPKLVQRVKPFCEIPEKETALYAYVKKIKFQSIPCPYAPEALRNDVRVMLNRMEERHTGIKFTIFKSIEKIRPALEAIAEKEGIGECSECGEPTTEKVCRTCQMLKQIHKKTDIHINKKSLNKKQ